MRDEHEDIADAPVTPSGCDVGPSGRSCGHLPDVGVPVSASGSVEGETGPGILLRSMFIWPWP